VVPPTAVENSAHTAFAQAEHDDLLSWGRLLASVQGPIVAIARKTPRLLELAAREGLLPPSLLDHVTTERGLVFLPDSLDRANIAICDDIIIYGSTYAAVTKVARECLPRVELLGFPYAASSGANLEELQSEIGIRIEPTRRLSAASCTAFENAEIASFAALNKPYDIDHPILHLASTEVASNSEIDSYLHAFARSHGYETYRTPRRLALSDQSVVERSAWSLLLPDRPDSKRGHELRKIRCYLDQELGQIVLVPISPIAGTITEIEELVRSLPHDLVTCWSIIREAIDTRASTSEGGLRRERSLVVWANYLLELMDVGPVLSRLGRDLQSADIADPTARYEVDQFDLQLLIGPELAKLVSPRIGAFLADCSTDSRGPELHFVVPTTPCLPERYRAAHDEALEDLGVGCKDVREVLSAAFRAQHVAVELPSRQALHRDPGRLEFGVPVGYLWETAERLLGHVDRVEFNEALDRLVDRGVAVPRFLRSPKTGAWFRSLRIGEAEDEIRGYAVRTCLETLSGVLGVEQLREVITEKFLVLVTDVLQVFKDPSLVADPGFERAFYLYGARPQVTVGGKKTWLVDWASDKRILKRGTEAGDSCYALDSRADRYYRKDGNPIPAARQNDIAMLARWVRDVLATKELGTNFLIALTTVESQWAYQQALMAELTGWAHDPRYGATAALHALDDLAEQTSPPSLERAKRAIEHLANWLAQARNKARLRENISRYLEAARAKWPAASYEDTSATWNKILVPAIESRATTPPRPSDIIESYLVPTLRVAGAVTSLLRSVLQLNPDQPKNTKVDSVEESARRLVDSISSLQPRLAGPFREALPHLEEVTKAAEFAAVVRAVRTPALLLARAVEFTLNLHPDFTDDPQDLLEPSLYVLFWDVRRSTEDQTSEPLTRQILEMNAAVKKSFWKRLTLFNERSADDGNALICRDLESVLDIARMLTGEMSPRYHLRLGCDTNLDGALHRSRRTGIVSGRAFAYAARMMTIFKEIGSPGTWTPDPGSALPGEPDGSYLIFSENAYRLATESMQDRLKDFIQLPGWYKPRVKGAIKRRVYLASLSGTATPPSPTSADRPTA